MATVLRREIFDVSWSDTYKITPLGDIHLGAAACDEGRLKEVIENIAREERHYWIGMGDYCDWINLKDPRFSVMTLADWITRADLVDLSKAQFNRLCEYLQPIAHKCLGLIQGNHEKAIERHTERDIYSEIVSFVKREGDHAPDYKLALDYYGWIKILFYNTPNKKREGMRMIKLNIHHGFTGGKLAGAKALDMQRWLWTHEADLVIFGHCHVAPCQPEAVEMLDRGDNIVTQIRKGVYSGTFLRAGNHKGTATYSEIKGYFPTPTGTIPEIELRPALEQGQRVRIVI